MISSTYLIFKSIHNDTEGGEMNDYIYKLCDELDAAIFTGDHMNDPDTKEEFKRYLKRWLKEIEEVEIIKQYLELSTVHLTKLDVKLLESDRTRNMSTITTDFGFKVFIHELDTKDLENYKDIGGFLSIAGYSDNFIKIVKYSLEKNCIFINFDRDAEQCELFEVYENDHE